MPRQAKRAAAGKTHTAKSAPPPTGTGDGEQTDIEGDRVAADAAAAQAAMTNWCKAETINKFSHAIRENQARIDEIMDQAKVDCRPYRDEMAKLKSEAADAGLPKQEFATLLRRYKYQDRIDNIDRKLDEDQKVKLQMMYKAVGILQGTPLGDAAIKAAGGEPNGSGGADSEQPTTH